MCAVETHVVHSQLHTCSLLGNRPSVQPPSLPTTTHLKGKESLSSLLMVLIRFTCFCHSQKWNHTACALLYLAALGLLSCLVVIVWGEPFQAWEIWLSPHSEKPVGSQVGGRTHVHGEVLSWRIGPALYLHGWETAGDHCPGSRSPGLP